jgi:Protein O-mannosyl-transferase TMEM260-like
VPQPDIENGSPPGGTGFPECASALRRRPTTRDRVTILIAVALPTLIAITRLPPGVCAGDSGDLQLSSVTLGIGHPPGYPILATFGYILTRIPFIDPAYIITLACALSGTIAAYLCGMIQLRLGVHPMIAGVGAVLFLGHPRVWFNVVGPEVYMPSMAMLLGALYCFMRFAEDGLRRHFFAATLLFGLTLFTRPPTLFALPFFLFATLMIDKRRKILGIETAKRTLLGALLIALPGLYSFGFILARDRDDVPYNYIGNYNTETGSLPETSSGIVARAERAVWMMTGQQFANDMGTTWPKVRSKLNWIRNRAFPFALSTLVPILAIVVAGVIASWRRRRCATIVLLGFVVQTIVFLCLYRVHGQAANLLPLLGAITIFGGVAISAAIERLAKKQQAVVATGIAILSVGSMSMFVLERTNLAGLFSATNFISQVSLETMPANSVIISAWGETTPLRYAHYFAHRPDIQIETISLSRWPEFAEKFAGRPVFVPQMNRQLKSTFQVSKYRNLYLLEPRDSVETG